MRVLSRPAVLAAGLAVLVWQACRNECCGPERHFFAVYVGVRLDSAAFRSNGEFVLELVPIDQTGQAFVSDSWAISTTLEAPTSVAVTLDSQRVQPADNRAVAAAIHIDNSGSMQRNDADRRRATAAQLFWNEMLVVAGGGNLVALLDFGRGTPDTPSPGFKATRLLQSFTSDASSLDAKLSSIEAAPGGGSRLYRSAWEVARWFDTTVAATSYKRTMVIITDGLPGDTLGYKDSLFAAAAAAHIRILAVGVGPASDHGTQSQDSAVAVLRELATQTNGVYAGADEPQQLVPILHALANVSTREQLLAGLRLDPVPPSGTLVAGTVTIAGARGRATAGWSFIAP